VQEEPPETGQEGLFEGPGRGIGPGHRLAESAGAIIPQFGAFLPASPMYFCSGQPTHFCSGVDTLHELINPKDLRVPAKSPMQKIGW